MLNWANQFNICCLLDNHSYPGKFHSHECLLAVGALDLFTADDNVLPRLKQFINQHNDWLFGHVSYNLKDEIEGLQSNGIDYIQFPIVQFFQPETVIEIKGLTVFISSVIDAQSVYQQITNCLETASAKNYVGSINARQSKQKYLDTVQLLKQHILRGDCYEINYCQEFYVENASINPVEIYNQLVTISPTPFAVFYKNDNKYLLCASPERYIKKQGSQIISQPIKGTIKRNREDAASDSILKDQLRKSAKDIRENVMIVDLVRNDLSKVCNEGSVIVDELMGVYAFPQVHQMISTITGEIKDDVDFVDILSATFPKGSMTGAPKRSVLELIEKYESVKRGIYSGAVGYITPDKNFDFNVVIRSIMYNASTKYLNYLVGGAITFYSDAEQEFAECIIKAEAINNVLLNQP
jgi:para-aminobenzoate synthetase component 1